MAPQRKAAAMAKHREPMNNKAPLEIMIADGRLFISIGVATLGKAVAYNLNNENLFDGTVSVTDEDEFAAAIAEQLRNDEDDGASPIQALFDGAAVRAFEGGAEGIELSEEDEDEEDEEDEEA